MQSPRVALVGCRDLVEAKTLGPLIPSDFEAADVKATGIVPETRPSSFPSDGQSSVSLRGVNADELDLVVAVFPLVGMHDQEDRFHQIVK